ncbi:MAG: flagellar hook-associated protein FlgK [Alphaproteobacteria bacterium 32-64-14]|nr:MAG: flagellar hook-associated protein FlgK [Alphaproteobacteria bacterium 32-64-14]
MSIQSIMGTGLSALFANQQALKAVSTNVANVNTVGYSRLDVNFVSRQATGGLSGVSVEVTRVANTYLAAAEMRGAADVSAADILAQFMDRAQGLLGDPSDSSSVFATLDPVFSSFGALAVDPASALRQSSALSDLKTLLTQLDTTAQEIAALRDESHARIISGIEEANSLMSGIARLNTSIQRATIGGVSATEAETEQQRMLDRLSEILDIRVQPRQLGGVEVRTSDGMLLVDIDAATLGLSSISNGEAYAGVVMMPPRSTTEAAIDSHLTGGELKGLLRARDKELVNLQLAFGEFAAGAAEALNAAHNTGTSVPAPTSLTGRNTGLLATDQLNFTGVTNVAIVDAQGMVVRNLRIDFGAQQILDDQANVTTFANSIGDLQTALDSAMGGDGQVSFANGQLSIEASVPGNGIAIREDTATPSSRAGRGFSHTFGLNDLVTQSSPLSYATGLSGTDLHGFTAGQTATFAMRDTDGTILRRIEFTVGAGATVATLRADLDAALQGYAQTALSADGRLTLVPTGANVARVDVLQDATARGDTNMSMSQLFGFGESLPLQRARSLDIRDAIDSNPALLATALADLSGAAAGQRVLSPGDGRGALAVEAASTASRRFADAGGLTGQVTSISDYAARLAGHAGVRAEALEASKLAAQSVRDEVRARRMGEEGVNLDEELVKMTTYQQAYAAASRMIQAARDLYDITLNMV